MGVGRSAQSGRFHLKCSADIELNTQRTTAWTKNTGAFGIAFSRDPIPKEQKFSVKVLQPGVVPVARSYYAPPVSQTMASCYSAV